MYSAVTNRREKCCLNILAVEPRFGSTKLAAATRGALALAVLSALLLMVAGPAQAQTETVLYNFCSQPNCGDGYEPVAGLTSYGGNFYGTTQGGEGTVFELSPNGNGGWNETVLYSFTGGADGSEPQGYVTFDSKGNLYGTTLYGGAYGYGVVFELSPTGGSWTETVLYSFTGRADGGNPENGLVFDKAGNLYGITCEYPGSGTSTVFELSPSGGNWTEQTIYSFSGCEGDLLGVTMSAAGNIFGTTTGTVFELTPNGNGGWTPTVIHTFGSGTKDDGSIPEGSLVLDKAGHVYGATYYGGTHGAGTIYKLSYSKTKGWTEKILYSFGGSNGANPWAGIAFDAKKNIYGTTYSGGGYGVGTVYELVAPKYTEEKVLWNFNDSDGNGPLAPLILDKEGNLYGTTYQGGTNNDGTVFEVTP